MSVVVVVAPFVAGSSFAHAINSVKMAEGFARLGHEVTLICRQSPDGYVSVSELTDRYGLQCPVGWHQVSYGCGEQRGFTRRVLWYLLRRRPSLVYARHYRVPCWTARMGLATVAETHAHPGTTSRPFHRMIKATHRRAFQGVVTISRVLAEHYHTLGVPSSKLWVLPDAVDWEMFRRPARLPPAPWSGHGPHIVYAGHLYDYKGIPTILEAATKMPQATFHLVGGWPDDIRRQRKRAEQMGLTNVVFHGLVPHAEVPRFLWHADVLLLPPSRHHPSARWTSPLKLAEYLASGTPVVATDIPALRAWVSDREVEWARPDDANALASAVLRVLEGKGSADPRAAVALAQEYSYTARASRVCEVVFLRGRPAEFPRASKAA